MSNSFVFNQSRITQQPFAAGQNQANRNAFVFDPNTQKTQQNSLFGQKTNKTMNFSSPNFFGFNDEKPGELLGKKNAKSNADFLDSIFTPQETANKDHDFDVFDKNPTLMSSQSPQKANSPFLQQKNNSNSLFEKQAFTPQSNKPELANLFAPQTKTSSIYDFFSAPKKETPSSPKKTTSMDSLAINEPSAKGSDPDFDVFNSSKPQISQQQTAKSTNPFDLFKASNTGSFFAETKQNTPAGSNNEFDIFGAIQERGKTETQKKEDVDFGIFGAVKEESFARSPKQPEKKDDVDFGIFGAIKPQEKVNNDDVDFGIFGAVKSENISPSPKKSQPNSANKREDSDIGILGAIKENKSRDSDFDVFAASKAVPSLKENQKDSDFDVFAAPKAVPSLKENQKDSDFDVFAAPKAVPSLKENQKDSDFDVFAAPKAVPSLKETQKDSDFDVFGEIHAKKDNVFSQPKSGGLDFLGGNKKEEDKLGALLDFDPAPVLRRRNSDELSAINKERQSQAKREAIQAMDKTPVESKVTQLTQHEIKLMQQMVANQKPQQKKSPSQQNPAPKPKPQPKHAPVQQKSISKQQKVMPKQQKVISKQQKAIPKQQKKAPQKKQETKPKKDSKQESGDWRFVIYEDSSSSDME